MVFVILYENYDYFLSYGVWNGLKMAQNYLHHCQYLPYQASNNHNTWCEPKMIQMR